MPQVGGLHDGLPEKSPNPPRHVLSHLAPLKFVFELCSLAQECIGEFVHQSQEGPQTAGAPRSGWGMKSPMGCTELSVCTDIVVQQITLSLN